MEIACDSAFANVPFSKLKEFVSCNHCKNQLNDPFVTSCCLKLFCLKCIKDCIVCPFCSSEQISIRKERYMEKFLSCHDQPNEEDLAIFSDCSLCFNINNFPIVTSCCNHIFCGQCVEQWTKDHKECPMCRRVFKNTKIHDFEQFGHEDSILYSFDCLKVFLNDIPQLCKFGFGGCGDYTSQSMVHLHLKTCKKVFQNHIKNICQSEKNLQSQISQTNEYLSRFLEFYENHKYDQCIAMWKNLGVFKNLKTVTNSEEFFHQINIKYCKCLFRTRRFNDLIDLFAIWKPEFFDERVIYYHAMACYHNDVLMKSIDLFNQLVEIKSSKFLGVSLMRIGDTWKKFGAQFYHKAQNFYCQAIKISNESQLFQKIRYRLIQIFLKVEDFSSAKKIFDEFSSNESNVVESCDSTKAKLAFFIKTRQFTEASQLLQKSSSLLPKYQQVIKTTIIKCLLSEQPSFVGDKEDLLRNQLNLIKDEYFRCFYSNDPILIKKSTILAQTFVELSLKLHQNDQEGSTQIEHLLFCIMLCHHSFDVIQKQSQHNINGIKLLTLLSQIYMKIPLFYQQNYQQASTVATMITYIDIANTYLNKIFQSDLNNLNCAIVPKCENINMISVVAETKLVRAKVYQYAGTFRSDASLLQQAKQLYADCSEYFILYDLLKYQDIQSQIVMCDPDLYGITVEQVSDEDSD